MDVAHDRTAMMKQTAAYLTGALTLAFVLSPAFTTPFSGFAEDQLPVPQIDPPIQPAGYAFSIWGVIYLWLLVSAGYGILRRATDADWNRARQPLIVSLAIGVPWLAIANASAIGATITIILMAVGAITALILAPTRDRWTFQAPVALYAGWLTAAACVSLGTTLAGYGVGLGAIGWAYVSVGAGLGASTWVFSRRPSAPEYLLAVIWALIGIVAANTTQQTGISLFAGAGAAILLALILRGLARG